MARPCALSDTEAANGSLGRIAPDTQTAPAGKRLHLDWCAYLQMSPNGQINDAIPAGRGGDDGHCGRRAILPYPR